MGVFIFVLSVVVLAQNYISSPFSAYILQGEDKINLSTEIQCSPETQSCIKSVKLCKDDEVSLHYCRTQRSVPCVLPDKEPTDLNGTVLVPGCLEFTEEDLIMNVGEKQMIPYAELTLVNGDTQIISTIDTGIEFMVTSQALNNPYFSNSLVSSNKTEQIAGLIHNAEFFPSSIGNVGVQIKLNNTNLYEGTNLYSEQLVFNVVGARCGTQMNDIFANRSALLLEDINDLPSPANTLFGYVQGQGFIIEGKTINGTSYYFDFKYGEKEEIKIITNDQSYKKIDINFTGNTLDESIDSLIKIYNTLETYNKPLVLIKELAEGGNAQMIPKLKMFSIELGNGGVNNGNHWKINGINFNNPTTDASDMIDGFKPFPDTMKEGEFLVAYYPGSDLHGFWSAVTDDINLLGQGVLKLYPYAVSGDNILQQKLIGNNSQNEAKVAVTSAQKEVAVAQKSLDDANSAKQNQDLAVKSAEEKVATANAGLVTAQKALATANAMEEGAAKNAAIEAANAAIKAANAAITLAQNELATAKTLQQEKALAVTTAQEKLKTANAKLTLAQEEYTKILEQNSKNDSSDSNKEKVPDARYQALKNYDSPFVIVYAQSPGRSILAVQGFSCSTSKTISVEPGFRVNGHFSDFSLDIFTGEEIELAIEGVSNVDNNIEFNLSADAAGGKRKEGESNNDIFTYQAPELYGNKEATDQLTILNKATGEEIIVTIHIVPREIGEIQILSVNTPDPVFRDPLKRVVVASAGVAQVSTYTPDIQKLREGDVVTLVVGGKSYTTSALLNTGTGLVNDMLTKLVNGDIFDSIQVSRNGNTLVLASTQTNTPFDSYISILRDSTLRLAVGERNALPLKIIALMEDGTIKKWAEGQFTSPVFGNLAWSITDQTIASISNSGLISGKKVGFATASVIIGSEIEKDIDKSLEDSEISSTKTKITHTAHADIEVIPAFSINGIYNPEQLKFVSFAGEILNFVAEDVNGNPINLIWTITKNQSHSPNTNVANASTITYQVGVDFNPAEELTDIIQVTDEYGNSLNLEIIIRPPVLESLSLSRENDPTTGAPIIIREGDTVRDLLLNYQLAGDGGGQINLSEDDIQSILGALTWETSDATIATILNGIVTAHKEGMVTFTVYSNLNPDVKASIAIDVEAKAARFVPNSTKIIPSFPAVDAKIHIETEVYFEDGIDSIQEVTIKFNSPYLQDAKLKLDETYWNEVNSRVGITEEKKEPSLNNIEEKDDGFPQPEVSYEPETTEADKNIPKTPRQARYILDYQLPGEKTLDGKTVTYTITVVTNRGVRTGDNSVQPGQVADPNILQNSISQVGVITIGSVQNLCTSAKRLPCLLKGLKCLKEKESGLMSEECDQIVSVFTNDPADFSILDIFKKYKELRK